MADTRALLRAEKQARRITHPNASYTTTGGLLCNLCSAPVKAESAWKAHLQSTQHTLRLQRAAAATAARSTETLSKKRKASSVDDPADDDRKRVKAGLPQEVDTDIREADEGTGARPTPKEPTTAVQDDSKPPKLNGKAQAAQPAQDAVDEAEWEAFERDIAVDAQASKASISFLKAGATIEAAPMTAEEVAAQAREVQSTQRGRRDVEIEAEREDAARLLEDEFEEMEGLEDRVRRLREKREALRKAGAPGGGGVGGATVPAVTAETLNGLTSNEEGNNDEDDEDDGYDEWAFGAK